MNGKQSAVTSAFPVDTFQFAGVYFDGAIVDQEAKLIRIPSGDITRQLQERLTRRELERVAAFCEQSIIAKDSPMAVVVDVRRPLAHFLFEQVHLVLAGGPRDF